MMSELKERKLEAGVPCGHFGCLQHVTHPCEGCGRIAGGMMKIYPINYVAGLQADIAELEKENKRLKDMLKVAEDTMNLVL